MTGQFKLKGLSAPMSFTCWNDKISTFFWAKSGMPEDRYKALFKYFKDADDSWTGNEVAILEYDKVAADGTPIEAKCVDVVL